MTYKPGTRLSSEVSTAQVVVVRPAQGDIELKCAGVPMVVSATAGTLTEVALTGSAVVVGKRYFDSSTNFEVLCTKGGPGPLSIGDRTLEVAQAKPLPSSD